MTGRRSLADLLSCDPADPGCEAGMARVAEYVDLECAGADADAAARFPEVAAHLRGCPDCREEHDSLLRYVRGPGR